MTSDALGSVTKRLDVIAKFHVVRIVLAMRNNIRVWDDVKKISLHAMTIRFQILKKLGLVAHVGQALKVVQELVAFVASFCLLCSFFVANLNPKQVPIHSISVGAFFPPWSAPYSALHKLAIVSRTDVISVPAAQHMSDHESRGNGKRIVEKNGKLTSYLASWLIIDDVCKMQ